MYWWLTASFSHGIALRSRVVGANWMAERDGFQPLPSTRRCMRHNTGEEGAGDNSSFVLLTNLSASNSGHARRLSHNRYMVSRRPAANICVSSFSSRPRAHAVCVLSCCPEPVCTLLFLCRATGPGRARPRVCPVNIIVVVIPSARRVRIVCFSAARALAPFVLVGPRPRPLPPACISTIWLRLLGSRTSWAGGCLGRSTETSAP